VNAEERDDCRKREREREREKGCVFGVRWRSKRWTKGSKDLKIVPFFLSYDSPCLTRSLLIWIEREMEQRREREENEEEEENPEIIQ
jgi:hypothetical protein